MPVDDTAPRDPGPPPQAYAVPAPPGDAAPGAAGPGPQDPAALRAEVDRLRAEVDGLRDRLAEADLRALAERDALFGLRAERDRLLWEAGAQESRAAHLQGLLDMVVQSRRYRLAALMVAPVGAVRRARGGRP